MSLTIKENSSSIKPVEAGTHIAVCSMLIDLGEQFSEVYKTSSRKVLIGWELADESIELEDGVHPRTISKRYTASLNERAVLRQDLAAWRGRDFTPQELSAFDLKNIVGAPCMINVIHKESGDRTYANVQSVIALPKGVQKPKLSAPPMVFDLDTDPLENIAALPEWIQKIITESSTYKERQLAATTPKFVENISEDDGDLPF